MSVTLEQIKELFVEGEDKIGTPTKRLKLKKIEDGVGCKGKSNL